MHFDTCPPHLRPNAHCTGEASSVQTLQRRRVLFPVGKYIYWAVEMKIYRHLKSKESCVPFFWDIYHRELLMLEKLFFCAWYNDPLLHRKLTMDGIENFQNSPCQMPAPATSPAHVVEAPALAFLATCNSKRSSECSLHKTSCLPNCVEFYDNLMIWCLRMSSADWSNHTFLRSKAAEKSYKHDMTSHVLAILPFQASLLLLGRRTLLKNTKHKRKTRVPIINNCDWRHSASWRGPKSKRVQLSCVLCGRLGTRFSQS